MNFPESVTGQDTLINGHLPGENSRITGQSTPNGSTLCGRDTNCHCLVNGSINGHAGLNGSALSSGYTNGHSIDGETVNYPARSNGSAQSDEYTNGFSINGDAVNGVQSHSHPPIAICGMALRLPAGLKTPEQLWEFLLAGGDARGRVPGSRYNVAAFHDPTGKHGTVTTEYGYFLDEDIGALDTSFFSMPRMEVERTDPQQRLMLEATRECFEDAGETAWRGKRIGCYMGSLGEDWCEMFARETQNWGPYRYTGFGDFALSNRVSYEMDLQGPRYVHTCNLILLSIDRFQYDHSHGVLGLACGPPRSVRGHFKGRLRLCHCWRRESDHDSRRNNEYDRAECTFKGRFLQDLLSRC